MKWTVGINKRLYKDDQAYQGRTHAFTAFQGQEAPRDCWAERFTGFEAVVAESGLGRVELVALFLPTVPRTDFHVDRLRRLRQCVWLCRAGPRPTVGPPDSANRRTYCGRSTQVLTGTGGVGA